MTRFALWGLLGAAVGLVIFYAARYVDDESSTPFYSRRVALLASLSLCGAFPLCAHGCSGEAALLGAAALSAALFHSLTDLGSGYIYDLGVCASVLFAAVVLVIQRGLAGLVDLALGAGAGGAPIVLVILLTRGGMGLGDAKMMAGIGALLGWKMVLASLYFGLTAGGVSALVLLLAKRVRRYDEMSLAPYLAFGVLLALTVGEPAAEFFGFELDFCR